MDTLLNPEKAAQYMSNKEKAMEDIRVAWQKVVTFKYVSLRVFYHKVILIVVNSIIFH